MRFFRFAAFLLSIAPIGAICQTLNDQINEHHYAYIPSGAGPFSTLIAMPGCSGISTEDPEVEKSYSELQEDDLLFRRHYREFAAKLNEQGFAVYLIDVHRSEGVLKACTGEIDSVTLAKYISAAIDWVADQPLVDRSKITLIGWSMGGRGVLEWLQGPRENVNHLKSAIAVYPGCDEATDLTVSIPILMLLGGADDIAKPASCEKLARTATVKDQIQLKIYPGARHGFDIEKAPPIIDVGGGRTVGYQRTAAEQSWDEILSFLSTSD